MSQSLFIKAISLFFMLGISFAAKAEENASNKAAPAQKIEIVAFGDSLTAGYGLGPGEGFVDQLQVYLEGKLQAPVKIMNAGVSGDTSSGGRSRLEWALAPYGKAGPDLLILELGANDGLRGVDPAITRENIDYMLKLLKEKNIPVLLAGMMAPPNLGLDYQKTFDPIFPDMAAKHNVALYPFFLDGVAAEAHLNQEDGIHPNKEGVAIIVEKIGRKILHIVQP